MRANAAHLREPREAHPLPGHGDEPAPAPDAEEAPHGVGAGQEGPRLGERGEGEHLRRVGVGQGFDLPIRPGRQGAGGDHLHALGGAGRPQAGWHRDGRHLEEVHMLPGTHQVREPRLGLLPVVPGGCEQVHVAQEPPRAGIALRQGPVERGQRCPDGPVQISHVSFLLAQGGGCGRRGANAPGPLPAPRGSRAGCRWPRRRLRAPRPRSRERCPSQAGQTNSALRG